MTKKLNYIDLFAGAGGLSEGFINAGFTPVAHVEYDKAACYTLRTRAVFHYLKMKDKLDIYESYLKGEISRDKLYESAPPKILDTVINAEIGKDNDDIFKKVDALLGENKVDLIVGGPPCQAYSYIGRAALKHRVSDERKKLYIHYGRFLNRYKPKLFVFENVPGLLTSDNGANYQNLTKYYKRLGYIVHAKKFNAYKYNVVQNRVRLIIIGWKKEMSFQYPVLNTSGKVYYRNDIFYDLPAIKPGEDKRCTHYTKPINEYLHKTEIRNGFAFVTQHITRPHNKRDLEIYQLAISKTKKGVRLKNNNIPDNMRTQKNTKDFLDRFKVVWYKPHALIAHIAKDGHHFIHPDKKQLRSISVREAARIQSFPDNYFFEGFKENQFRTAAFKQIGNAVPILFAQKIAEQIKLSIQ